MVFMALSGSNSLSRHEQLNGLLLGGFFHALPVRFSSSKSSSHHAQLYVFFHLVASLDYTGRLLTNSLMALRAWDSVWALQIVDEAKFHSFTLG